MPWPAYWLEPTGLVTLGLRRYTPLHGQGTNRWTCQAGWHQAMAWRGAETPERWDESGGFRHHAPAADVDRSHPGWPLTCQAGCGYRFTDDDEWQPWEEEVYVRPGGGRYLLHPGWAAPAGIAAAGPGAIWDAWWLPDDWRGPDGIALMVRCPRPGLAGGHDWPADGPATGGGRWTRTGDPRNPPTLTVTPSIAIGDPREPGYYHGHLRAGVLTDHAG